MNSLDRQQPAYKGVWEAKKIANHGFKDDDLVYQYDDLGFFGFDFWQVNGSMIFNEYHYLYPNALGSGWKQFGIAPGQREWCPLL